MTTTNGTKKTYTPPRRKRSAAASAPAQKGLLPREEIARRAYEIYLTRGGEPGRELDDWLQAERDLHEQLVKSR
jgi:hypothetical protein